MRQHGGGRARQHNICFLGAISLAFVRCCQKGTWSFEVFLHLACFVCLSGLWHSECYQRVNERNLQVSSAGDVVETTHICGRLLSCLSTFATVVWVFTKRRSVCFGEFCSPDEVAGVMLLLESSDAVNSGRHLEVQFWLRSSVGRVTPICAVAFKGTRNRNRRPTQHKRLFFVCGVCEVVRDSSNHSRPWPCSSQ